MKCKECKNNKNGWCKSLKTNKKDIKETECNNINFESIKANSEEGINQSEIAILKLENACLKMENESLKQALANIEMVVKCTKGVVE